MSLHRSLKSKDALVRRRNVLTRGERIEELKKSEDWQEGTSAFGLPKVTPAVAAVRAKVKVEKPAEGAEPAEGTEAGRPAT